jgi:hypothetical protein
VAALDVAPNNRRLATAGANPQVIIWNMAPILDAAAEADPAVPKKLAVLQEHTGVAASRRVVLALAVWRGGGWERAQFAGRPRACGGTGAVYMHLHVCAAARPRLATRRRSGDQVQPRRQHARVGRR